MINANRVHYLMMAYWVGSLTAMAPMNLTFFLFLFGFIVFFVKKRPHWIPELELKHYRFWALLLLVTCWGSLLVAKILPFAYADHAPEVTVHGFLKIWYLIVPFVLYAAYRSTETQSLRTLMPLIKPWWVFTLILSGVAFVQFFSGWPQPQSIPTNPGRFHAILFFGHHLSTASIIIFPAFTALAVFLGGFCRSGFKSIPDRLAMWTGFAGVLILFLSYARTAWLALLIGLFLLIKKYLFPHISRKHWLGVLVSLTLAIGLLSQTSLVHERIRQLMGVNERVQLWKANYDFFLNRPLTGIGWLKTQEMSQYYFKSMDPENYRNYFWGHAHSNFFEMLGGTGLFGLLAFLGWTGFTLRLAYRTSIGFEKKSDHFKADFSRGILIALILLHFNGLTNVTFWEGKVMHQQMLAVGMLLILNHQLKNKKPEA